METTPENEAANEPAPEPDEEEDDEEPFRNFEVIGITAVDANRAGHNVIVGDIMRLKKTVVNIDDEPEEAVSCVLIRDGTEVGEVGFIPTYFINDKMIQDNIDKHVQVVDLFRDSKNPFKKEKDAQNLGVAGVVLLDGIPGDFEYDYGTLHKIGQLGSRVFEREFRIVIPNFFPSRQGFCYMISLTI